MRWRGPGRPGAGGFVNPLRCKVSRRPGKLLAELHFFLCPSCGRLLWELGPAEQSPSCCGRGLEELCPLPAPPRYSYEIRGGFDNNAVLLFWEGEPPRWAGLQTFTGFYAKIAGEGKKAPLVFPLADEDAYVYCGRQQCAKCLYACKKGCALYISEGGGRLFILSLDEIAEYFRKSR